MQAWREILAAAVLTSAWAVARGQEPVTVPAEVMAGQVLTRQAPVYPAIALAARVQGAVTLRAVVGEDGLVKNLQVVSGPEMLRGAAIDAVRRWTYKPYLVDGEAKPVDTTVIVDFDVTVSQGSQESGGAAGQPRPERRARISGGVMAGQILTKVAPVYPEEAKAKGISGAVVLRAVIGTDGRVQNVEAISGPEVLRQAALDAVSQWTYKPYLLNGQPVEVDTTVTVSFSFGPG